MHADGGLLAKEALGILAHDAGEDVEHSGVGAATFPAIVAGLEEAEFFGGIEGEEGGILRQRVQAVWEEPTLRDEIERIASRFSRQRANAF